MNNKNKMKLASLLLVLLCFTHMQAKDVRNSSFAKGACAVGMAVLGVAGLTSLANWCFSETDDQLLARGATLYDTVCSNYRDLSRYLENSYHVDPLTPAQAHHILGELKEDVVYGIGLKVWNMNEQEYTYRSTLRSYCSQIYSLKTTLAKHIYKLESSATTYDQQQKLRAMRKLIKKIEETSPHLTVLSDFFEKHSSYYALFWNEGQLLKRYSTELNLLSHYSSNQFLLSQHINQHITTYNNGKYPYVSYINQIEQDLSLLRDQIDRLEYNYAERIGYAQQLFQSLHYIKGIISSHPQYGHELYTREQDRLHNERIAAFKNQLQRAEQERVKALNMHREIVENTINVSSRELNCNPYCN